MNGLFIFINSLFVFLNGLFVFMNVPFVFKKKTKHRESPFTKSFHDVKSCLVI